VSDDLTSVLYSSSATDPFSDAELADLLSQSRRDNGERDVTGMLLYRAGRFFQVLEGPRATVHALLERISADARHTRMRTLIEEPIRRRAFAEWTMGFEPIETASTPRPEGFRDTFDDLESDDATAVMRAARELSMWFRVRSVRTPR
jgi:hypothetical protein